MGRKFLPQLHPLFEGYGMGPPLLKGEGWGEGEEAIQEIRPTTLFLGSPVSTFDLGPTPTFDVRLSTTISLTFCS